MRKLGVGNWGAVAMLVAMVTACGGGDGAISGGTGGGGNSSGGTTGDPVYRAGSLSGTNFSNGVVAIGTRELAAGGQTAVAVDIVDASGARALGIPATVSFFSDCASTGKSTFAANSVSTSTGHAETTYLAQGCQGTDQITAIASVGSQSLVSTGTVTVQSPDLGSVGFVSAEPAIIGMAGGPIAQQSTVIFRVVAKGGGALSGQTVSFTKSADSPQGVTLSPESAISDGDGLVRVTVKSGSEHGVVRITASSGSGANIIRTDSDQLVITTGFPHARALTLGADKLSVDGQCNGEPVLMSIRLADRYANPVAEGTAVTFTSTGGKVNGQCTTGDPLGSPTTEAGVCSTLLSVQNPRPASGRPVVTASAQGEESFFDANGDGFYNGSATALCANDTPTTECYYDFNGNGRFDGYVCDSPGVNCRSNNIELTQGIVIVFSTGLPRLLALAVDPLTAGAVYDSASSTLRFTAKKAEARVTVVVKDSLGNPLPTGTTYTMETDIGAVPEPATVGPFNTNNNADGANTFSFRARAPDGDENDTGAATLKVVVPASQCRGVQTYTIRLFGISYVAPPATP